MTGHPCEIDGHRQDGRIDHTNLFGGGLGTRYPRRNRREIGHRLRGVPLMVGTTVGDREEDGEAFHLLSNGYNLLHSSIHLDNHPRETMVIFRKMLYRKDYTSTLNVRRHRLIRLQPTKGRLILLSRFRDGRMSRTDFPLPQQDLIRRSFRHLLTTSQHYRLLSCSCLPSCPFGRTLLHSHRQTSIVDRQHRHSHLIS